MRKNNNEQNKRCEVRLTESVRERRTYQLTIEKHNTKQQIGSTIWAWAKQMERFMTMLPYSTRTRRRRKRSGEKKEKKKE